MVKTEPSVYDAVVIGAGLCGLTAAYRLYQAGLRVSVLEQSTHVGGVIQTRTVDGYTIETGPHTFQSTAKAMLALCHDLKLPPKAVSDTAKKRYIYYQGQLEPVPMSPGSFLKTPLLSLPAKCRLLMEPLQTVAQTDDETVGTFIRRRLGPMVLDNLMGPFLSGVYAGNPDELSMPAVFPSLWAMEQESGSLFNGMIQRRQQAKTNNTLGKKQPYQLFSFEGGMGQLPIALAKALPAESLQLNRRVTHLLKPTHEMPFYRITTEDGQSRHASTVVVATPAPVAANFMAQLGATNTAAMLQDIHYVPVSVVHMGIPKTQLNRTLDGFGFLVPRHTNVTTLGAIWSSALFPERCPDSHVLMSAFIGGAFHEEVGEWGDDKVTDRVLDDLTAMFQSHQRFQPDFTHVIRWSQAIPQYRLGHREQQAQVSQSLSDYPGVALIGNYRHGVSVNDCVIQGNQAAECIIQQHALNSPSVSAQPPQ